MLAFCIVIQNTISHEHLSNAFGSIFSLYVCTFTFGHMYILCAFMDLTELAMKYALVNLLMTESYKLGVGKMTKTGKRNSTYC